MNNRLRWWIFPSALLLAGATLLALDAAAGKGEGKSMQVTVSVRGLPAEATVHMWEVETNMDQSELVRADYVGSISPGAPQTFAVARPILEMGEHVIVGGGLYRPTPIYYHLGAASNHIEVAYIPHHALDMDLQVRVSTMGVLPELIADPPPPVTAYYEFGTIVTVKAEMPAEARMAYWLVRSPGAPPAESAVVPVRLAPQAQLRLEMNRSLMVTGVFAEPWSRLPRSEPEVGIRIANLAEGQAVRLVDGDVLLAQARIDAEETQGRLVPEGAGPWRGHFQITGPDGHTVVFESPDYDDLLSGDGFAF